MNKTETKNIPLNERDLHWDRDYFLRTLIRELSGTLQDVVGTSEAAGFISVVGQSIGKQMNSDYRKVLSVKQLDRQQVEDVLVDLKSRIKGDFYVIESDDHKIVMGNRQCPFAEKVKGRESMCMMTSNVFGSIAADNLGYAKVVLDETIAQGCPECKVTVYLEDSDEAAKLEGREYFQTSDD